MGNAVKVHAAQPCISRLFCALLFGVMAQEPSILPFLVFVGIALISGAFTLALTILIISRKVKKQPFNYAPAMLAQFISLMICLGSAYFGARILLKAQPLPVPAEVEVSGDR
jgi:ABC-type multidrug transport system permease subunit